MRYMEELKARVCSSNDKCLAKKKALSWFVVHKRETNYVYSDLGACLSVA